MRLLVAEGDRSLADALQFSFQQEHFSLEIVFDCRQFAALPGYPSFDLLLLDTNVSGVPDGDVLQCARSRWHDTPIILISGEISVEQRILALNTGADDVVMKPFVAAELVARVGAVLRRQSRAARDLLIFEDLEINRVSHEVCRALRPTIACSGWFILNSTGT